MVMGRHAKRKGKTVDVPSVPTVFEVIAGIKNIHRAGISGLCRDCMQQMPCATLQYVERIQRSQYETTNEDVFATIFVGGRTEKIARCPMVNSNDARCKLPEGHDGVHMPMRAARM